MGTSLWRVTLLSTGQLYLFIYFAYLHMAVVITAVGDGAS